MTSKHLLFPFLVLAACGGAPATPTAPTTPTAPATPTTPATPDAPKTDSAKVDPPKSDAAKKDGPALAANAKAAVEAADRDADDKAMDAGRHPGQLLDFCGVPQGGKVAEIAAGGGYTAELLVRAVGPSGKVYGQNSKWVLEKFAEKPWSARLAKPVNKGVLVRVDREFDDPLPADAKGLDVVVDNLFYHDTFWLKVDRDKMNKAIFAALKPGGVYCVVDHSGRAGTGATEVQTIHRIEEKVVKEEIEKAGFKLSAESPAWRNASDTRDWNAAPFAAKEKRGTSDRFAFKFVKP
jgi:predicted methyltransferase